MPGVFHPPTRTLESLLEELAKFPQDLLVKRVEIRMVTDMGNKLDYSYPAPGPAMRSTGRKS